MKRNNDRKHRGLLDGCRVAWSLLFTIFAVKATVIAEFIDIRTDLFGAGGNMTIIALVCIILALAPFTGNILRMFRKAF